MRFRTFLCALRLHALFGKVNTLPGQIRVNAAFAYAEVTPQTSLWSCKLIGCEEQATTGSKITTLAAEKSKQQQTVFVDRWWIVCKVKMNSTKVICKHQVVLFFWGGERGDRGKQIDDKKYVGKLFLAQFPVNLDMHLPRLCVFK